MANPQDIERFKQGKDKWNEWARANPGTAVDFRRQTFSMVEFEEFEFPGTADFSGAIFNRRANFRKAKFLGEARFRGCTFNQVDFSEAHFQEKADLKRTRIQGVCNLRNTTFSNDVSFELSAFLARTRFVEITIAGEALFEAITFHRTVILRGCRFSDRANFRNSIFKGAAWFDQSRFKGLAQFDRAVFEGIADFRDTRFSSDASFNAASSEGSFSLAEARFAEVPDFVEMSFHAAPRLDNVSVADAPARCWRGQHDKAARYRALKKLAIDAHDHTREQQFFANELRERRGSDDRAFGPGAARFWFGFAYELLSDFGKSIGRPLALWGASILLFGIYYFHIYLISAGNTAAYTRFDTAKDWVIHHLDIISAGWASLYVCQTGDGQPFLEALLLSLKNALLFIGWDSERIRKAQACLFGVDPLSTSSRLVPAVPYDVVAMTLLQTTLSGILLFLLLLAIRNHFRIR